MLLQVPYILSIGEGAAAQQREREDQNYIGENQFAKKAREDKAKKEARKGSKLMSRARGDERI